ncbi:30S ribosomal protein S2 [Candidatus Dojkabacteria bacterium]|uniref:Small ribosomal subunit protein uS2 n=1 Tax=Candidatus Dojkabacteria bacterium TaxID=2099670 RepID=A0A3M0Z0A7_9BACT|nr:MAG: 30S ribosomal protein S2 [Candidatus Dojkabacteria bacterium]
MSGVKLTSQTTDQIPFCVPSKDELLAAGVQFGHQVQRWNPKMKDYILGVKNGIHIIDVEKTLESLSNAVNFLMSNQSESPVLFVATKRQARSIVRDLAVQSGSYFVDRRWVGGLFTNFSVIKKSLEKLEYLERVFMEGVTDRTKFEVNLMKKKWDRLSSLYGGIKTMRVRPSAIVILDVCYEKSALVEARKVGITTVAVVDTNADPEGIDYPIFANDDAISSIKIILDTLAKAAMNNRNTVKVVHNFPTFDTIMRLESSNLAQLSDDNGLMAQEYEMSSEKGEQDSQSVQKVVRRRLRVARKSTNQIESSKGILGKYQAQKEKDKNN